MKQEITFRTIFSYYWKQAKKYPKTGMLVFVLYGIGIVLTDTLSPLVYKEIIDVLSGGVESGIEKTLTLLVGLLVGMSLLYNIAFRLADYCMVYFQSNVLKNIADYTFQELHKHSYTFFSNNFSGSLVTKAKRFSRSFETIHDQMTFSFLMQGIKIVGAMGVMFFLIPLIGFVYVLWLVLYFTLIAFFVRWKLPYDKKEAEADSHVTARYADTITNALAVKMFASRTREYASFQDITQDEESKRRKAWNIHNIQMLVQGMLFFVLETAILIFAVWAWYEGKITVGTVVLLQIYVIATFGAVWNFGRSIMEVSKSLADAKEMVEIFEQCPDIQDADHPEASRIQKGHIVFRDISFSYEKKQDAIFQQFSFEIKPGEKIGLIGHSGAGKTTITKLLLRFSDISSGSIEIDGQNIQSLRQEDLRKNISYVPQEPLLFHRSIRENIAYGKPTATNEEIEMVAQKARAHDFISRLPKGYDTLVGERGVKLSGGERQRVAIARAMLKDAPILILDEATSSLDSMSERYIQEALDELMKGKTVIVVAHRLSTIQKMDRIVVIEMGDIVEEGTHKELLNHKGVYAEFWNQQAGGFLMEGGGP